MSIEAMNAVWEHSKTGGNTRLVMLAIANAANPQGWDSFQYQETIAKRAGGISLRTVERCVAEAIELGELEVHRPDRSKQNHYSVLLAGLAIADDESERERRDEHYEKVALGRAEKTRQRRANRRSVDPTAVSGPSAEDPTAVSGGTRQQCRVGPDSPDGWDPTAVSGLKEETPINTIETPLNQRAREVDKIVDLIVRDYPKPVEDTTAVRLAAEERVIAGASADEVASLLAAWSSDDRWAEEDGRWVPRPEKFLRDRRYHRGPDGKPVEQLLATSAPADVDEISASRWRDVRKQFGEEVGGSAVLGPVTPVGIAGGELLLASDKRTAGWIELRYARQLAHVAAQVLAKPITAIRFVEPPAHQGVAA